MLELLCRTLIWARHCWLTLRETQIQIILYYHTASPLRRNWNKPQQHCCLPSSPSSLYQLPPLHLMTPILTETVVGAAPSLVPPLHPGQTDGRGSNRRPHCRIFHGQPGVAIWWRGNLLKLNVGCDDDWCGALRGTVLPGDNKSLTNGWKTGVDF